MVSTDRDRAALVLEVVPKTMRHIRTEMRKISGEAFTVPQYRLLAKICREDVSTNGELAQWMGVSSPTMSKMIDRLVERKLVHRRAGANDARRVAIAPTKAGQSRAFGIRAAAQRNFAGRIGKLSLAQKRALEEGLGVLRELFLRQEGNLP